MEMKQTTQRKMSEQMRAVMTILSSSEELLKKAKPYVDLGNESINWDEIFKVAKSASHQSLVGFAFALWRDELKPRINIFDGALNLDRSAQMAILQAMMIRWNLSNSVEFYQENPIIKGGAA